MTGQIIIFPQRKGGAAHAMTYKNSSAARQARWSNCEAISLVRDIDLGDDSTAKFILIAIAMFPNWGELSCEVTDKEIAVARRVSAHLRPKWPMRKRPGKALQRGPVDPVSGEGEVTPMRGRQESRLFQAGFDRGLDGQGQRSPFRIVL